MRELGVTYTRQEREALARVHEYDDVNEHIQAQQEFKKLIESKRMMGQASIGLGGPAGAGKDTAARYLADTFGYETMAWADRLRAICRYIWPDEPLEQDYREKMTNIGRAIEKAEGITEPGSFCRGLSGPSYKLLDNAFAARVPMVVTDTRFPTEYDQLEERGFVMVRIQCSRQNQIARLTANGKFKGEEYLDTEIEHLLDDYMWHETFDNDGDPMALYEWLNKIVRKYVDSR